jgi:hypothetical protein
MVMDKVVMVMVVITAIMAMIIVTLDNYIDLELFKIKNSVIYLNHQYLFLDNSITGYLVLE